MIQLIETRGLFSKDKVYRLTYANDCSVSKTSKRLVLLCESPEQDLTTTAKTMLDKLVRACKFQEDEVVFLYSGNGQKNSSGEIQRVYSPELILILGNIPIGRNALPLDKHKVYDFFGMKVLVTSHPSKLENNEAEKAVLWGLLKSTF
ncbi:MAG: hypothetical protein IPP77_03015 [Bacteroidetes bacterium]|nr:hypothetical protein [Bacteroidota bacterium]